MLVGALSHGYMLFNKISFHDDVTSLFGVGATIKSGRWGLEGAFLFNCILLNVNSSMPVINGVISLFFIAVSTCLVVKIFGVESCFYGGLIGGVMAAFPVVASTFLFMFTAPYYFCALFFAVFATYLILKKGYYLKGTFLFCFSLSLNTAWKIFYHIPLAREGRTTDVAGITIKEILARAILVYQSFFIIL